MWSTLLLGDRSLVACQTTIEVLRAVGIAVQPPECAVASVERSHNHVVHDELERLSNSGEAESLQ